MKKGIFKTAALSVLILAFGLLASCAAEKSAEGTRGFLDLLRQVRFIEATVAYPWPAAFIWGIVAWVVVLIILHIPVKWTKPKAGSESRPTFLEILQDVFGGTEKARRRTARVLAVVVYAILVLAIRGIINFFPGREQPHPPEPWPGEDERHEGEPFHREEPPPPEPGPW
jgi:hypothetical protein